MNIMKSNEELMKSLWVVKELTAARQVGHGRPLSSKHAVMTFYDEASGCPGVVIAELGIGPILLMWEERCSKVQEELGCCQIAKCIAVYIRWYHIDVINMWLL